MMMVVVVALSTVTAIAIAVVTTTAGVAVAVAAYHPGIGSGWHWLKRHGRVWAVVLRLGSLLIADGGHGWGLELGSGLV